MPTNYIHRPPAVRNRFPARQQGLLFALALVVLVGLAVGLLFVAFTNAQWEWRYSAMFVYLSLQLGFTITVIAVL